MKSASRLVSFDSAHGDCFRPIATPIYQVATCMQEHTDAFGEYDYSPSGTPHAWSSKSIWPRWEMGHAAFLPSYGRSSS
jgi:cystathionine beta-lyase/cystathionine gamma-synthase